MRFLKPHTYFLVSRTKTEGYPDIETYISDLNALIHGHQMKMAAIFAQRDVVTKLLKDQVTVCDTLAESIKNSQSSDTGVPSETGVQDIIEAMAKRKYYDEELKKINLEGVKITMELNEMLFVKMHMEEVHGV